MYVKTVFFANTLYYFTKPVNDFKSSCSLDNILLCHLAKGVLLLYQVLPELNITFNLRKVLLRIRPGFISFISACNLDFHMKIPSAPLPQVTIQRNDQTRVHSAEVVVCREGS